MIETADYDTDYKRHRTYHWALQLGLVAQ